MATLSLVYPLFKLQLLLPGIMVSTNALGLLRFFNQAPTLIMTLFVVELSSASALTRLGLGPGGGAYLPTLGIRIT